VRQVRYRPYQYWKRSNKGLDMNKTLFKIVMLASGWLLAQTAVPAVHADALKCQQTINSAYGKYLKGRTKIVQNCQDSSVRNASPSSPTDCPVTADDAKLLSLEQKLRSRIGSACGGSDKMCNGVDDELLTAIGWDLVSCPDLDFEGCTNLIVTCDDVATCVACIADEAGAKASGIAYDQLEAAQFDTGSDLNDCQRALGKETVKYFQTRAKLLGKCWSKVAKGSTGFDDPPGCPLTDTKLTAKLLRAEQRKIAKICRACGGVGDTDKDGQCDDLFSGFSAFDIGFEPDCPDSVVPSSGRICNHPVVETLAEVIDCVDCVAEFLADCGGEAVVPASTDYPPECTGGP
jgi:hypothetical protein